MVKVLHDYNSGHHQLTLMLDIGSPSFMLVLVEETRRNSRERKDVIEKEKEKLAKDI